eukprot:TRINITY_DN13815_c0_g1_i1.p1 TRINITY_DN13815_c0_g1~~TRINITY_DN13815_c0_g1_i1.p1  ORF type:complete len:195 (-),score=50.06 TRINITY_DN13815_c0_g1_i1:7-591(-)
MFSHRLPYSDLRFSWEIADAVSHGRRPLIDEEWNIPKSLLNLINLCWEADPVERPDFKYILFELYSIARNYPNIDCSKFKSDERVKTAKEITMISLEQKLQSKHNTIIQLETQKQNVKKQIQELQDQLIQLEVDIDFCKSEEEQIIQHIDNLNEITGVKIISNGRTLAFDDENYKTRSHSISPRDNNNNNNNNI